MHSLIIACIILLNIVVVGATSSDSISISGIWNDNNNNTIVLEEKYLKNDGENNNKKVIEAGCVSSDCAWVEASGERSAEGKGGMLSIIFSYQKPDGILKVGPILARISGNGKQIDFFQNNVIWVKIGEGLDSEKFSSVTHQYYDTVAYIGKHHRIKQCKHGLFMLNYYDTWVSRSLGLYGEWSEYETSIFLNLLQPGDVVIDAGANIGSFTIPMAKKVGAEGTVYAFEPQRFLSQTLSTNVILNELPNVYTMHMALGDHVGTLRIPKILYDKVGNFGAVDLMKQYPANSVLPLMTIDSLMLPCPKLIKIDVEGMEIGVIKGSHKTLHKCKPFLYVENNCVKGSKELILEINSLGYTLFWDVQPYYNADNYFKNNFDMFPKGMMSINMLGIPNDDVNNIDMSTWIAINVKDEKFYLSDYMFNSLDDKPLQLFQNGNLTSCVR
eukprot:g7010.t1